MSTQTHFHALTQRLGLLLTCALLTPALNAEPLRVNQTNHPLDAYAVGAIRVALQHMPKRYQLEVGTSDITQARAVEYLQTGEMDLMWLATDKTAEETLRPIRFPLLKGLLGHRVFIINQNNQSRFSDIRTINDLKELRFGQGAGWPDVEILRSNGFTVITTSKYENLFHMTEGGRFDAFPRGVLEPWVELAKHNSLGLSVERKIVLIYTLPFYLFVDKNNTELANDLHAALDAALADGSFDNYFYNSKMVNDALTRSGLKERLAFRISNPLLSKETPLERKDYWLDLNDL
ncbi:transporter substrate-binding domain-containing protein [Teredinibacter turnerae]|uniref:transporter substrate-binding domain-containing protein n=1 Tax=Teredinibacter turnerae TaxID=2426 RepID=UPI000361C390|nr:transporter substrate-binding domain-containing protein [Teredinibacter turnerae]